MDTPTIETAESLAAAEIAAQTPAAAPKGVTEEEISHYVNLGLYRHQAIEILTAKSANEAPTKKSAKKS